MPVKEIRIILHDDCLMQIRRWYPEGRGLILAIGGQDTVAANDDDSRRYLMERVLKAVRESSYRLIEPEEEED